MLRKRAIYRAVRLAILSVVVFLFRNQRADF
jgi:hypothetical protein